MAKINTTLGAVLASLFANSQKAISEKLEQDEFNAFSEEASEVQTRLDTQAAGNAAMNADLTAANEAAELAETNLATATADLTAVRAELATANTTITGLKAKADQWDAYKASLTGAVLEEDSTNGRYAGAGKGIVGSGLSASEQARNEKLRGLKAKHPLLMADVEVIDEQE